MARVEAEAAFRQMARRFVVARGVAEPDGRFVPGKPVAFAGLGPIFSGTFVFPSGPVRASMPLAPTSLTMIPSARRRSDALMPRNSSRL